ncbi:MAG: 2-dehydro-3-deoxy-6-phosphogalactonate aldolase [Phenylobacterium sp.]|jgi:2-dehydro-3-deoxyphosphogalactonate aldolase|uniref:2-dehydro-3-deoxy-6-phosphogalactonate aldolase n=1 Tax=Phenylobacterium sp. TaxID=1871053 RepID=UPI002A2FD316|nr:2-dehydro-3-deoxy-6-phosphogalactonate aldolase [Phenylobacterium sp.]MDD3838457.1 2-dehydro-3-deoxy-6-phosphogalactonate aldolase [Phenylobacterium sp.]MDX9999079.1 2-dehydro-3-deoxy-6-phosphogalactonate aldolase [Phenylobacterium sp.]
MRLQEALAECPVVAIVRGITPDEAVAHAEALFAAGVRGIEVPLNSPEPFESIRRLAEAMAGRMAVGAGTVLRPQDVNAVQEAGGTIIVAPNTNVTVIRRALELDLDPAPGFATATEAFAAYEAGARHLKLFPAATYGLVHLRQLSAVLPPDVVVWAVGGVGAETMAEWRAAGAGAFGIGGELFRPGQSVEETAQKAAKVAAAARSSPA